MIAGRGASSLVAGLKLGWARLLGRRLVAIAVLSLAVTLVSALIERRTGPFGAADRALGVVTRWVIPLASFALTTVVFDRERLRDSVWSLARFGHHRGRLALGLELVAVAAACLLAVLCVEVALVTCYGARSGLGRDAWVSGWISALGASAYIAWYSLAACVLRAGRGRWLPLVCDFVLGSGTGGLAVIWPRAHLRNLIGDEPVLGLTQGSSSVVLAATAIVLLAMASLRSGD